MSNLQEGLSYIECLVKEAMGDNPYNMSDEKINALVSKHQKSYSGGSRSDALGYIGKNMPKMTLTDKQYILGKLSSSHKAEAKATPKKSVAARYLDRISWKPKRSMSKTAQDFEVKYHMTRAKANKKIKLAKNRMEMQNALRKAGDGRR